MKTKQISMWFITLLLFGIFVGATTHAESTDNDSTQWEMYTDSANGFVIEYPKGWYIWPTERIEALGRMNPSGLPPVFCVQAHNRSNFYIFLFREIAGQPPISEVDYRKTLRNEFDHHMGDPSKQGVSITSEDTCQVSGSPGLEIKTRMPLPSVTLIQRHRFTIIKRTGVCLVACGPDTLYEQADTDFFHRMFKSFQYMPD